jgi:CHAT domain-containing protein
MAEGFAAWQRGDLALAVTRWQAAERFYAKTGQPHEQRVALTHLAYAYSALGHYQPAIESLRTALQLAERAGDPVQRAFILNLLGQIAMDIGNLADAEGLLSEARQLAGNLDYAELLASILHTQGNLFLAQQQYPEALAAYRESAAQALQARQAGMAARALAHAALAAEQEGTPRAVTALLMEAHQALQQAEPSHDTAYDLLLIGQLYQRLAATDPSLLLRAVDVLTQAAQLAQTLQDARATSYAWGYLGRLYEGEGRYAEALDLTRRATLAAQQVYAPEALYLWQWQSGRLLRAQGDLVSSMAVYERALATVQSLRSELLHKPSRMPTPSQGVAVPGGRGIRTVRIIEKPTVSFRDTVGPLYFELTDLFLRQAAAAEENAQTAAYPQVEWYLHRARTTVEQFKTAELRDYFGDECVAAAPSRLAVLEQVAADTVIVYPILLPDRTELLVSLPMGLKRIAVAVPGPVVAQQVQRFRAAVEAREASQYLSYAQEFYTWLIRPVLADLRAWRIESLVFVPDGALRLLPWAALHDGQHFLIEQYALAITPSLTLTEPHPFPQEAMQALAAGVAKAVEDFPALPHVTAELQSVQQHYGGTVLLDQAFSTERFDKTLQQGQFGIVHIASHGHFAADAASSFLLTAQGKLTIGQLAQMVGRLRFRAQPLELLTLSACETAQGDDRAALGLAGVAIQAGARSALATLWRVADDAAAILMKTFYQQLRTPGVSRARALQQAQVALLQHQQYQAPFFWAPFVLINNWL